MQQPKFNPQFFAANVVVMNGDDKEEFCTDKIDRVTFPGQVLVYRDYSEAIGLAHLKIEGQQVLADIYFEQVPEGMFPVLQGEPSEQWHPEEAKERVVALDGDEDNIMICEVTDDDKLLFTSVVFSNLAPLDTRIQALDLNKVSPLL